MKRKDITYKYYQSFIKDKDKSVNLFTEHCFAMLQSMFHYDGLPSSIPQSELERILQYNGTCIISDIDDTLYAFGGTLGGDLDVYQRPTKYNVSNVALHLYKEFTVNSDCVLFRNDSNSNSILPIIGKYSVLYTDGLISLNTASILSRITMMISASDERTKQSAEMFLQKILDGEFSVIGENAFFKGVNLQTASTSNTAYINQLVEYLQYIKASFCNTVGLNANYNMKRERLTDDETQMNVDVLLPYVENMLYERKKAVELVNEKYGTEITVHLNSSWKLEQENAHKLLGATLTDGIELHNEIVQNEVADEELPKGEDRAVLTLGTETETETEKETETETEIETEMEKEKDNE